MLSSQKIAKPLYFAGAGLLLVAPLVASALYANAEDWRPLDLVLILAGLSLLGQHLEVTIRGQEVNATTVGLGLAMGLLGPAPAMAFGLAAMVYTSAKRRRPLDEWLANLSTYAAFPFVGGLMVGALVGNVHNPHNQTAHGFSFGLAVFVVFMITLTLNFLLIAAHGKVFWRRGMREQTEELFVPLLPAHFAAAVLTAVAALAYTRFGFAWSLAFVVVVVIFQKLIVRLIAAEDLAEDFRSQVFKLVSSQIGQIDVAVKTLDTRDPGSERHAATVAIYARELAAALGCGTEDQNLAHTAGLAHDIGRLRLADRLLHAEALVDESDWQELRRHPVIGADWVGRIHGYGPVADVILSHHERWDGTGYPDRLIGPEIPLLSRVVAICEAFDVMTGRGTYRPRISAQEAFEELHRGSSSQFDPDVVDAFIELRSGQSADRVVIDDADFNAELDFERRTRMLADPELTSTGTRQRIRWRRLADLVGTSSADHASP
jgi:HD-GYP domain-containing protein (c-di-GMP phosphodiesterase class II)